MTYKCETCSTLFDEPDYIHDKEYADYGIGGEWITLFKGEVCPFCESNEFNKYYPENEEIAP